MKNSIQVILLVVAGASLFIGNTNPSDPASQSKLRSYSVQLSTDTDTNMLFVDATINNKQRKMLVDNGAPTTLFIDKAGLDDYRILNTTKIFDGEGDTSTAYIAKIKKISIGNLFLKKQYCLLSINKPQYFSEMGVSGIIGHNILNQFDYTLDFVNFNLVLKEKSDEPSNKGEHTIALEKNQEGLIFMHLRIDTTQHLFQVDYGSSGLIDFSIKSPLPDFPKSEYTKVHLIETINQRFSDTSTFFLADSIFFASDLVFTSVPVTIRYTDCNLIGMKFFKQFESVTISNSHNTMILTPIPIEFDVVFKQVNCFDIPGQSDSCMISSVLKKTGTEYPVLNVGNIILKPAHVSRITLSVVKGVAL